MIRVKTEAMEHSKLYLWVLPHRTTVVWLTPCGEGVAENAAGDYDEWWFQDELSGKFYGPLNVEFNKAMTDNEESDY